MHRSKFKICLTGGGTAGHVVPHFALYPEMQSRGWDVFYIGSNGIEKELVEAKGIPFNTIAAGKLRRYLSMKNFLDVFKVGFGCLQAFFILLLNRPNVVFSKGGFVAVPVAIAAWFLRIPIVSHESDVTPGLANKIIKPFAKQLLVTFPETVKLLGDKAIHVGTPIRKELFSGDATKGNLMCGFKEDGLPAILVMGGSQGAKKINDALSDSLPQLVLNYKVIHLCGKGKKLDFKHERYCSFEYVNDGIENIFALANIVVSRAGANSIFELLALRKPMILIPLAEGSRGDQVVNAKSFERQGYAIILNEAQLTADALIERIHVLFDKIEYYEENQSKFESSESTKRILDILEAN